MTIICMHMLRLFAPQLDALRYVREKAGPPRIDLYFYPPPPLLFHSNPLHHSLFSFIACTIIRSVSCFLQQLSFILHVRRSQALPVDTATEGRIDSLHVE